MLKFSTHFPQGAPHFCFALNPVYYVVALTKTSGNNLWLWNNIFYIFKVVHISCPIGSSQLSSQERRESDKEDVTLKIRVI